MERRRKIVASGAKRGTRYAYKCTSCDRLVSHAWKEQKGGLTHMCCGACAYGYVVMHKHFCLHLYACVRSCVCVTVWMCASLIKSAVCGSRGLRLPCRLRNGVSPPRSWLESPAPQPVPQLLSTWRSSLGSTYFSPTSPPASLYLRAFNFKGTFHIWGGKVPESRCWLSGLVQTACGGV